MSIEKYHTGIKLEETMLALLFEGILEGSEEDKRLRAAEGTPQGGEAGAASRQT